MSPIIVQGLSGSPRKKRNTEGWCWATEDALAVKRTAVGEDEADVSGFVLTEEGLVAGQARPTALDIGEPQTPISDQARVGRHDDLPAAGILCGAGRQYLQVEVAQLAEVDHLVVGANQHLAGAGIVDSASYEASVEARDLETGVARAIRLGDFDAVEEVLEARVATPCEQRALTGDCQRG